MKNLLMPAPESLCFELSWAKQHQFGANWVHFAPRVACASLWQIVAGELYVEDDQTAQTARAGDWVWRAASGARRVEPGKMGAKWNSVGLVAMRGGKNWFAPPHSLIFRPAETSGARGSLLMELLVEGENNGASRLEIDGLSRALMGWLWDEAGEANWLPNLPNWLEQSLRDLELRPGISVAEMTQNAHFSPAQFRRLWETYLGCAPRDSVLKRRLEIARGLLESESWSVSEIAVRSGFAGAAQLSRAFRGALGVSPLEWRRAAKSKF